MPTENEQTPPTSPAPDEISAQEYIKIIADLKQNTVPKTDYDKLRAEKSEILKAFVNGDQLPEGTTEKQPTVEDLRKELFGGEKEMTNLEYVEKSLLLRKQLMEKGSLDPFLPVGYNITPTEEDISAAARVADVLQQCVDYAQGDSTAFTNELQRRTVDVMPMRKAR